MRGGQNRKTRRQKAQAGTLRPYRERGKILVLQRGKRGRVRPPLWLKPVAVAKWDELAAKLQRGGILTELSEDILANACMHWEIAIRCYHRVSRDGPVVKNERGRYVKHPALQVLRENSQAFRDCLVRMGMTPVDARRASVSEPDADQDQDVFG